MSGARITVVDPGLLTLVQDAGRWGYLHLGVPVCGPMDPFAFESANALVGNDAGAAALEVTAVGPRLRLDDDRFIAVGGGDLGLVLNARSVESWRPHLAEAGSEISFAGRRSGARAYLAVSGGIDVRPWLGSRSTYLRGAVGGLDGRALRAGDSLPLGEPAKGIVRVALRGPAPDDRPPYSGSPVLRVILGPHRASFTARGVATFLGESYRVTELADRMGYRLDGPGIEHAGPADVSSCGLPLGAIQVPGNGQPIILMADHQTAGGYPLIACVIQADIPLAAQCLPGDSMRFRAVDLREARAAIRAQHDVVRRLDRRLEYARSS